MVNENNIQILSDSSLKPMDIKIGIGIPVFNEEETIKLHLQNLFDVIKILPIYHFFVFIIDDGSVDSTLHKFGYYIRMAKKINWRHYPAFKTFLLLHTEKKY